MIKAKLSNFQLSENGFILIAPTMIDSVMVLDADFNSYTARIIGNAFYKFFFYMNDRYMIVNDMKSRPNYASCNINLDEEVFVKIEALCYHDMTLYEYKMMDDVLYKVPKLHTLVYHNLYPDDFLVMYDCLKQHVVDDCVHVICRYVIDLFINDKMMYKMMYYHRN